MTIALRCARGLDVRTQQPAPARPDLYRAPVAYDEELADRVRAALGGQACTEQPMFGGLSFLVGGRLCVAAARGGGLLVHVDPAEVDALLGEPGVGPMRSGSRTMRGWLLVDAEVLTGDALAGWVARGVTHAGDGGR